MDRLKIIRDSKAEVAMKGLLENRSRRTQVAPSGNCPVSQCAAYARQCMTESCGKCVPCRVGLSKVSKILEKIVEGYGVPEDLDTLNSLLDSIADSADCAIGFSAAMEIKESVHEAWTDFESHVYKGECNAVIRPIPCQAGCPAHVDIPGYIALTRAGRYKDAVRVIRQDNPLPATCAMVCEHPCENYCRRNMIDDSLNIRGIKRAAIEGAGEVEPPECLPSTGKKVAVIGAGPSGLTVSYFLQLMGHQVDLFDRRAQLGGMLRYGIPRYRLPEEYLNYDINAILSTGVKAHLNYEVTGEEFKRMQKEYDAVYISIGAHASNKLRIEGDDADGVISAVELLRAMGDDEKPDFAGKRVVIVGGGNVAMDCTRTARRLGAESVTCVYRRRRDDMTAQNEEVEGAIAESCEVMTMMAPVRVETDETGKVRALIVKPQIPGAYDRGRPKPVAADKEEVRIECDYVIAAIGQAIDSEYFANAGIPVVRNRIKTRDNTAVDVDGLVFAGGDSTSGPATAILAIEAGKTAAANIDRAFGYDHKLKRTVEIPPAQIDILGMTGRIDLPERAPGERQNDFDLIEGKMTEQEIRQECSRCLRCDHHGMGSVRGGRKSW